MLGTNGGGFFNANSAHPFENPTALTNFIQIVLIFSIGAALTNVFGRMVGDQRQGWAVFAAMGLLFLAGVATVYAVEVRRQPGLRRAACRQRGLRPAVGRQYGGQGDAVRHRQLRAVRHHHHRHVVRRGQHDARQLAAAGRNGAAAQHPARRGDLRRRRLRALRHAAVRHRRSVRGRADGGAHAGISRQENRGQGGEDVDARHPHPAALDPRLHRACRRPAGGDLGLRQCRPAWVQRGALRLHLGDRQQWQRVCRDQRQHAVLEHHAGHRDAGGAVPVHRADAGSGRVIGGQEDRAELGRHFPDQWRPVRRPRRRR